MGDYRYATLIAGRIAERTGAVVAPTIPWGYSELFRSFPGTVSLRPETFTAVLTDLTECFIRFGLDHLVFVCCHNQNMPLIEQVARRLREQLYRLRTAAIEPWSWFTPTFRREV